VGFFSRKNPTASVGSEPAISGTRGQHANPQTTEAADMYGTREAQTRKKTSTCCTPHAHPWVRAHVHALSLFQYKDVLKSQIKIRIQILWQVSLLQIRGEGALHQLSNTAYKNLKYELERGRSAHLHAHKERISVHRIMWRAYVFKTNTHRHAEQQNYSIWQLVWLPESGKNNLGV
jgi:hypothetical protein